MEKFVRIHHADLDAYGRCAVSAVRLWEGLGWVVVPDPEPVPAPAPEPKFVMKKNKLVPADDQVSAELPEWTDSATLEVEATGAAADEESTA